MNHREPTSASTNAGQALSCLALLLLPLLAADRAWSRPIIPYDPPPPDPTPYLVTVGSPALRFLEAAPPPDLGGRPPAAAPPQPASDTVAAKPDVIPFTPAAAPTTALAPADASQATPPSDSVQPHSPAPILPDELRPRVRAEDFLPYFEIPATRPGDPNVIVPIPRGAGSPAPLPASSATYTQTPK